jgi:hypothetical protein
VPLDGLLEAVDALHAGRNAVGIAGGRPGRGCGMATVAGVEGVLLSRLTNGLGNARIARGGAYWAPAPLNGSESQ